MNTEDDRALVDHHIRSAVRAAKRKGAPLTFSLFLERLRARNPTVEIHKSYVLDQLVKAATENKISLEIDHAD